MVYWLVYELVEPIDGADGPFRLYVALCDTEPPNSINGPFDTSAEAFRHMMIYLQFDALGFTHRK